MKSIIQLLVLGSLALLISCGKDLLPIKATVTITPTTGKAPLNVQGLCTIETGEYSEIEWNWGDNTPKSYGKTATHTYQSEGTFSGRVVVIGVEGNSRKPQRVEKPFEFTVTAQSEPAPSVQLGNYEIKERVGIDFSYKILDNGARIVSESWSFPGGTPSSWQGANPPTIRYNRAGNYKATVTVRGANGKTGEAFSYITVSAINKILYSGITANFPKLRAAIEANTGKEIQFVRFTSDNYWLVSHKNGFQSYGETTVNNKLSQYQSSSLRPATYIGDGRRAAIFYGNLGSWWQNCPTGLTTRMQQYYNENKTPQRLDFDNGGNWVYWAGSSIAWSHSTQPALVTTLSNFSNAKGFTFGYNNNVNTWVVFSSTSYAASNNVPNELVNTLSNITSQGYQIIDVEMQGATWVLIYR